LSFDLKAAERAIKPQRARVPLAPRADSALRWAEGEPKAGGGPLLIDTTVYIDTLQGRIPAAVCDLLRYRSIFHSAVCLAELTHAFGRLDPVNRATKAALKAIGGTIDDIPRHRLFAPDIDTWGKAGMLAGKALRLARIPPGQGQERKLLNDSLIYLQARKVGAAILTRNRRDFDLLEQLAPSGAVVFYGRELSVDP
jgi:predicted nucleic acid-binding protein